MNTLSRSCIIAVFVTACSQNIQKPDELAAGHKALVTLDNPYKNYSGGWYGTASHTHTCYTGGGCDAGATNTPAALFASAAPYGTWWPGLQVVPINDKVPVNPAPIGDPGGHPGIYYLPGFEETSPAFSNQHMVCSGCATYSGPYSDHQSAINDAQNQIIPGTNVNAFVSLAHPEFQCPTPPDHGDPTSSLCSWNPGRVSTLTGFDAIEVINEQGCTLEPSQYVWDYLLSNRAYPGNKIWGVNGNDLYFNGFNGAMFINSATGDLGDIIANMKAGNFYSTDVCNTDTGCNSVLSTRGLPMCAMRITDGIDDASGNPKITANLYVSEVNLVPGNINWLTFFWYCGYPNAGTICQKTDSNQGTVNSDSFIVQGNEKYVRLLMAVPGGDGNPASWSTTCFSQPIFVNNQ